MKGEDARRDLRAEARTVEDAVVADVLLKIMDFRSRECSRRDPGRKGLADA